MNQLDDHQKVMISQYYPGITQVVPNKGEAKPWQTRKKNKGETSSNGVVRKRRLTEEQVNLLERSFGDEHKLETERKDKLASELGLDPHQVTVWFQNKRARWKNKKLEEEYYKLKTQHETTIIEKYRLETEVWKMKEELCEAEKEIQRLLLELNNNCARVSSNNSPITTTSSLFTMDQSPFPWDFGMDNDVFVADQSTYITTI